MKSNIDYKKMMSKIKNSRLLNACLAAFAIVLAAVGAVLVIDTAYALFAVLCVVISITVFSGLIHKNISEAQAAKVIAESAIYAALLSPAQKQKIKTHQIRRGQMFYFSVLIAAVMPAAIVLTAMYIFLDSTVYTLYLGVYALISAVFISMSILYHGVRLTSGDNIILLSKNGIILGKDVLPFDADNKDALELLKFKDYYYLKFVKPVFFGIKYVSDIIIPVNGVLRKGKTGTPDDEIVMALGFDDIYITEDEFYESKDYFEETDEDGEDEAQQPKSAKAQRDIKHEEVSENPNAKIYRSGQGGGKTEPLM